MHPAKQASKRFLRNMHTCLSWLFTKQVHCMPGRGGRNSLLPYADDLWPGWDILGLFASMPASCCAGGCLSCNLLPAKQSDHVWVWHL